MNILDIILSRRTVHTYTSEVVPREVIEKAVLAGIHAPNHKLTWPWRFYSVGPETREQLAVLQTAAKAAKAEKKGKGPMSEAMKKALHGEFLKPGALLILGMAHVPGSEDPAHREAFDLAREDYAALACAVQNMSLYLADQGYGTKWATGNVTRSDKTYEVLGLRREEIDLCGWLWIGRAAGPTRKPERPPVAEFLKYLK